MNKKREVEKIRREMDRKVAAISREISKPLPREITKMMGKSLPTSMPKQMERSSLRIKRTK